MITEDIHGKSIEEMIASTSGISAEQMTDDILADLIDIACSTRSKQTQAKLWSVCIALIVLGRRIAQDAPQRPKRGREG